MGGLQTRRTSSTFVAALALSCGMAATAHAQNTGTVNQAGQTAGNVANTAGQTVGNVAGQAPRVLDSTGRVVGQVGDTAGNLVGGLQPTLQPVTQGVGGALNNLTQPDTVAALLEFLSGVIPNHIEAHVNLDALRVEKLTVDVRGVDLRNLRVDLLVANSRNAGQVRPALPSAGRTGTGTGTGATGTTGTGFTGSPYGSTNAGTAPNTNSPVTSASDTPIEGASTRNR